MLSSSFRRGGPVKTGKRNVNRTPRSFLRVRNVSFPYPPRKFIPLNCFDSPSAGQLEIPLNRHTVKSECEIKPALTFVPINDENIE